MKLNVLFTWTAGLLLLAGCSSTPTKVDSGAIQARTFNFVDRGAKPAPTYADNRERIHSMIQGAITKNLAGRGITRTAIGGDITVGYLVIVGNNASTTSINEYFGLSQDSAGLQEKAQAAVNASKNPSYFEAGTLVIDLIDSKTFKLLKRGYASRPILRDLPDDARAVRIQEVVDEILRDLHAAP